MFQNDLASLITTSDEQSALWRAMLQSIHDHGGSSSHLNALLADAKGARVLMAEIAQLAIGKVWRLVKEPVDLGLADTDFQCPPAEFLSRYPGLKTHPNVGLASGHYSETKPKGPCRYRLHHLGGPALFDEVLHAFDACDGRMEHAGWRELVAYVSRLQSPDLCGCPILAAGSRNLSTDTDGNRCVEETIFPAANGFNEKIDVAWKGVKRRETEKLEIYCFFLVRVYE